MNCARKRRFVDHRLTGWAAKGVACVALLFSVTIGVMAGPKNAPLFNCTGIENGIVNGSFETGFSGWIATDLPDPYFPLSVQGSGFSTWFDFFLTQPTDGSFVAFTGFDGCGEGTITLAQDVSITPCTVALTFDYRAAWDLADFGASVDRHFRVEVQPAGGGTPLQSWTLLTATAGTLVNDTGTQTGSIDLSPFMNMDVRVVFAWDIPQCYSGPAQCQLDNVRLSVPTIHASAGASGTITPAGDIPVPMGGSQNFTFSPDAGYAVKNVVIDNKDIGYEPRHSFVNVVSDHTIRVNYFPLTAVSQAPVITSFTATPESGNAPLDVTFSATAQDPDGGQIIQYRWDFDGDGIYDVATSEGTVTHRYVVPKTYPVTVMAIDDQWESTVSDPLPVFISKLAIVEIPVPTILDVNKAFKVTKGAWSSVTDWVVNPFAEPVNLTLTAIDADGNTQGTLSQTIPAHGKQALDFGAFFPISYTGIKMQADHYVILASDLAVQNARIWSNLPTLLDSPIYASHIAQDTGTWQTLAFLSNGHRYDVDLTIGGTTTALGDTHPSFIDLGSSLPDPIDPNRAWGKLSANTGNVFSDSHQLSGFEMFIRNGGDGASMEMPANLSNQLFLPAIPLNTGQGWKGIALVNPNSQNASVTITLYTADGTVCNNQSFDIASGEKYVNTLAQIFPDLSSAAAWGKISSTLPITGIVLLGGENGGVAGISLNHLPDTELYTAMLDASLETSVSITNPSASNANVTLTLYSENGATKGSYQHLIAPGAVFTQSVATVFANATLAETDYIMIQSSSGVLGTISATNNEGSMWMALAATH